MNDAAGRHAILVHGCCDEAEFHAGPGQSKSNWLPWAQAQLAQRGYAVQAPEFPKPYAPRYQAWKAVLDRLTVDPHTTLIGYSCGGGLLLRWLTATQPVVRRLVIVAPWLDPFGVRGDFVNFELDRGLADKIEAMHFLYCAEDATEGVQPSVALLKQAFPHASFLNLAGRGHFSTADMGTTCLPDLIAVIDEDDGDAGDR